MSFAATVPSCVGPLPRPTQPCWKIPEGAWDTHFHVLGPQARFPYAATRKYTPPDAPLDRAMQLHDELGVTRGLVVHANTHGFDNSVDLDAVARSGGRYLAVVRLDWTASREACQAMHAAGARGVRFAFNPRHGGTLDVAVFDHVLKCIDGLNWFVELHFDGKALPDLHSWLVSIPATVVVDHLGRIDPSEGIMQKPFTVLVDLVRRGNYWVKLSGADRVSKTGYPYEDVRPFAARLGEIAVDRLLWGSDWPHTGIFTAPSMPDDGKLLDAFAELFLDDDARRKILVDNPEKLLGLSKAENSR